ncbi:hypothetical protein BDZ85DRAFT_269149 [Elsinoe ampelina]|uniref:Uncharacterized protein n=1 Tax=Elsinoe ampelina TaxID=302913 RepID=A0A6A6G063_9PEZI|nr:hypothetical protein BDZ85DRAFT_269149 [Elsinoe ampelina]
MGGDGAGEHDGYAGEEVSIYLRLQRGGVVERMHGGREGEGYLNGSGPLQGEGDGEYGGGYGRHDLLDARYRAGTNGYSQQAYDEERYGEEYHPQDEWEEQSPPQLVLDPSLEAADGMVGKAQNEVGAGHKDHRSTGPTFALDPALEMLDGATNSRQEDHQGIVGRVEEEEPPGRSHHNGHGTTLKQSQSQDPHNGEANGGLSEEGDRRHARSASLNSDTIRVAP